MPEVGPRFVTLGPTLRAAVALHNPEFLSFSYHLVPTASLPAFSSKPFVSVFSVYSVVLFPV